MQGLMGKLLVVGLIGIAVILSGCGRASTPTPSTPRTVLPVSMPTSVPTQTPVPPTLKQVLSTQTPVPPTPAPALAPTTPTPTQAPQGTLSQAEMKRVYCEGLAKRPANEKRAPVVFCGQSLSQPAPTVRPPEERTQASPSTVTEEEIRQFCASGLEQMQICSTIVQQYGGDVHRYCRNGELSQLATKVCQRLGSERKGEGSSTFKEATVEKPPVERAKFVFCDREWRKLHQGGRDLNAGEREICEK